MPSEIYKCICNKYTYKVFRKQKRKEGHRKILYCPFCKKDMNFVKLDKKYYGGG